MFTEISEQAFLSMASAPIQYIGIYELNWIMDDNLLDCEGIIIAFEDRKILISSKEIGEEDFDFVYYDFLQESKLVHNPQYLCITYRNICQGLHFCSILYF